MKIWRYNACFCCLNCLPGGRQFPPPGLGIFKSMQNTAHCPATNCRLLPELGSGDNQSHFLLFRDESILRANLFWDILIMHCFEFYIVSIALRNVLNPLYPLTFWSWIIPTEMRAWVWAELCDMETEFVLQHNDIRSLDFHWCKNLGFKGWLS